MKKTILITEDEKNKLQRLHLDYESRKNIIIYIISKKINIDEDRFNKYQEDYEKKYLSFLKYEKELINKYIIDLKPIKWNIDYFNNKMVIEYEEK